MGWLGQKPTTCGHTIAEVGRGGGDGEGVRSYIGCEGEQKLPYNGLGTLTIMMHGIRDRDQTNVLARTMGSLIGWIVRSFIGYEGGKRLPYNGLDTLPIMTRFKNTEGRTPEGVSLPKRTVSWCGFVGLLEKGG
ncbi:hypothetical protein QVD17_41624 [Tagetes erecta]|uniref:Uncharacterized protein n=1 Tax=Tagetes erecta TaxID=13708 RepID=A0AAD8JR35_TARER|nr:hypothetical protein QVD17_41624 [Tagetes erecta]